VKKIIAYSTASQLGYMLTACGFSDYVVTMFHLINHAFFKALLFLCAGVLIHNSLNEQDLRKIIVSFEKSPLTITCLDIGILCLVSFPLFGGFYSKDLILETTISSFNFSAFSYYCSLFGALLTSGYASLLAELGSEEEVYSYKILYFTRKDSTRFFSFSLSILALLSIFSGALLQTYFDTISGVFFDAVYMNSQTLVFLYCREYTPYFLQILPLLFMFLFLFI
jgi:NADH-ubiquinone oxidoreductase chain 5